MCREGLLGLGGITFEDANLKNTSTAITILIIILCILDITDLILSIIAFDTGKDVKLCCGIIDGAYYSYEHEQTINLGEIKGVPSGCNYENIINYGFTSTPDNVCKVNYIIDDNSTSVSSVTNTTFDVYSEDEEFSNVVCDQYANGTLSSCLADGGYILQDLCGDIMMEMWSNFEKQGFIMSFGILKLIGVIIFTLIDICKFCGCWYCDKTAKLRYCCVGYLFIIKCIFWFFALTFAIETVQATNMVIPIDEEYPTNIGSLTSSYSLHLVGDYPVYHHVYYSCAEGHPVIYYDISAVNGLGPFADLILTILLWCMFIIRIVMLICCGTGSIIELGQDGYELVHGGCDCCEGCNCC
eukprot:241268_1